VSIAVHPGVVKTQLHHNVKQTWSVSGFLNLTTRSLLISEEEGAYTQIYAATHPRVATENWNGSYLEPMAVRASPSRNATNAALAQKLWDYLDTEIGPKLQ